jgi:hypothetical protein
MALIIGSLEASITVVEPPPDTGAKNAADIRDEFMERARAQAERRFEEERRIDQRDPDLLGGR